MGGILYRSSNLERRKKSRNFHAIFTQIPHDFSRTRRPTFSRTRIPSPCPPILPPPAPELGQILALGAAPLPAPRLPTLRPSKKAQEDRPEARCRSRGSRAPSVFDDRALASFAAAGSARSRREPSLAALPPFPVLAAPAIFAHLFAPLPLVLLGASPSCGGGRCYSHVVVVPGPLPRQSSPSPTCWAFGSMLPPIGGGGGAARLSLRKSMFRQRSPCSMSVAWTPPPLLRGLYHGNRVPVHYMCACVINVMFIFRCRSMCPKEMTITRMRITLFTKMPNGCTWSSGVCSRSAWISRLKVERVGS